VLLEKFIRQYAAVHLTVNLPRG